MLKALFKSGLCWLWVAVLVLVADFASKQWVVANLTLHDPVVVLPFFNLTLAHNTGAAFSFLDGQDGWQNVFFVSLAFAVGAMILGWLYSLPRRDWWMSIALNLVLGGALGNVYDRLSYGYVIDFLSFHINDWHFAIFNIADSAICVGAFMTLIGWWCYKAND